MIQTILLAVLALVVLLVIFVSLRPSAFRITRSALFSAPPGVVFPHVNDFHKWEAWSPWAKMDPNAKNTFNGAASGEGAIFSWAGNNQVGEGRMTILESRPTEFIKIKLEFFKPFTATNTAEFTFKPEGDGTQVTWTMYGNQNFLQKAFTLVMDCDKMVGGQFEKGLASLKSISEAEAGAAAVRTDS